MTASLLIRGPLLGLMVAAGVQARTLEVGAGKEYRRPSAAAAEARDGDTVRIESGDYYDCAIWTQNRLTIAGANPGVVITDTTCQGKALFIVTGNDVAIRDLTLARARVADRNGAGIRLEGRELTLERVRFANNEVGLLAGVAGPGAIRITDCAFEGGGRGGDRPSFAVLVSAIGLLRIENASFSGAKGGQIASAADRTELIRNRVSTGTGEMPAVAVLATGGVLDMEDNVLSVGPAAPRLATAVLATGEGKVTSRGNRLENKTGRPISLLIDWTGTDSDDLDNQVGPGDRARSTDGLWRHRAAGAYHAAKDELRARLGRLKRGVQAMTGR